MALFSQRTGQRPVKTIVQLKSMDDDLRTGLWNCADMFFLSRFRDSAGWIADEDSWTFLQFLWMDFFKWPLDTLRRDNQWVYGRLRGFFFEEASWLGVYDFVEYLADYFKESKPDWFTKFATVCNHILKRELSGYRFVGQKLTPVSSEEEIASVEAALALPDRFRPVSSHIKAALSLFADRKSPNYRNSIKESISAVEAMCRLLTGHPKATLGQAIKKLEDNGVALHPAFRDALSKLYGYTNDADGIRHALLDESNLDADDAKFMLVSCSAFSNYLAAKSAK